MTDDTQSAVLEPCPSGCKAAVMMKNAASGFFVAYVQCGCGWRSQEFYDTQQLLAEQQAVTAWNTSQPTEGSIGIPRDLRQTTQSDTLRDGPRHDLNVDHSYSFEGVKVKSLSDGYALNTLRQPTQSDVRNFLPKMMDDWCAAVAKTWGQGSQTHNVARDGVDIVRAALRQPTQSDALVSALVEASEGLKQDLLNRAEWDEDVKVVCAGAGAWFRFTTALAALQEQSK